MTFHIDLGLLTWAGIGLWLLGIGTAVLAWVSFRSRPKPEKSPDPMPLRLFIPQGQDQDEQHPRVVHYMSDN